MSWQDLLELTNRAPQIIGFIVLCFGLIGGLRSFYLWVTRPRIELFFDKSRTFHKRNNWVNNQPCGTGIWVHVFARGKYRIRKDVITGCRAYLQNAWTIGPDHIRSRTRDFNAKIQLQWAHSEGKMQTEIFPQEIAGIDLFMIPDSSSAALHIASGTGLLTGSTKRFDKGEYVFEISCVAKNAKRGDIFLKVVYDGGYTEPQITVL